LILRTSAGTAASGSTAYAYDLGDRLVGLTPPGASATTFTYDALGRIATRSVPGAGTDSYSYVGLTEDAWQVSNGSAATASLVGPNGSRLSVLTGSTLGWTIPDLHGSLVATTDSADALSSDQDCGHQPESTRPTRWTGTRALPILAIVGPMLSTPVELSDLRGEGQQTSERHDLAALCRSGDGRGN
jgi:YD repeat-containing protein